MLFGRLFGWLLIAIAAVMVSADAVMALGPADYAGIITADVVTLLTGDEVDTSRTAWSSMGLLESKILDLPAWVAFGISGLAMLAICRKRPLRRFRHRSNF